MFRVELICGDSFRRACAITNGAVGAVRLRSPSDAEADNAGRWSGPGTARHEPVSAGGQREPYSEMGERFRGARRATMRRHPGRGATRRGAQRSRQQDAKGHHSQEKECSKRDS